MTHTFTTLRPAKRLPALSSALLSVALTLSACGVRNSGQSVQLPQQFRIAPPSGATSIFESKSGRIAISGPDGNLVVVDQTGNNPLTITRDADLVMKKDRSGAVNRQYVLPIWSPDGKRVAVLEERRAYPATYALTVDRGASIEGSAPAGTVLHEHTLNGSNARVLTESVSFKYDPAHVTMDFGDAHVSSAIYTVVPDGKSALKEIVYSEAPITFFDWSPTGDRLGMTVAGSADLTLRVVDDQGHEQHDIARGASIGWDWNIDGETLIAQTRADENSAESSVRVHAADNGEELSTVVADGIVAVGATQYSPDGNYMVVSQAAGDGKFDLVIADRDGKVVRKLKDFSGLAQYAWSPAGAQLAYIVRETPDSRSGALRLLNVNTGAFTLLTPSPVAGFFWSPNGATIAAFSPVSADAIDPSSPALNLLPQQSQNPMLLLTITVDTRAARQVLLVDPTERFLQVLLQSDRFSRALSIWAPNSRHLLVPIRAPVAGNPVDYIIETESTGSVYPRPLGPGSIATWSPQ